MNNSNMPDRLNYTVKANKLIERIDQEDYMSLGKTHISRSELFIFALSLGIESSTETQLTNIYSGGLVLDKSIDARTKAAMYAYYIYMLENADENIDAIADKARIYRMAEQFANTGFEILEDYMNKRKPFDLALDLFLELDEQYALLKQ